MARNSTQNYIYRMVKYINSPNGAASKYVMAERRKMHFL